jgi:hypothetical protein
MTPKLDERISSLETRLKQLKSRQARLEARKKALASQRARKDDTRRKILAGTIVLARVQQDKSQSLSSALGSMSPSPARMIGRCLICQWVADEHFRSEVAGHRPEVGTLR